VNKQFFRDEKNQIIDSPAPARPDSPGYVLRFMQELHGVGQLDAYPCITMPRVLFGSQETTDEQPVPGVPDVFNATSFDTLRWRYHGPVDRKGPPQKDPKTDLDRFKSIYGHPKALVDVAAIPEIYFGSDDAFFSIHRPIKEYCPELWDENAQIFGTHPVSVNHYLGSWERYSGRSGDPRRSRENYDAKDWFVGEKDDG